MGQQNRQVSLAAIVLSDLSFFHTVSYTYMHSVSSHHILREEENRKVCVQQHSQIKISDDAHSSASDGQGKLHAVLIIRYVQDVES